jgi:hypothetical protein
VLFLSLSGSWQAKRDKNKLASAEHIAQDVVEKVGITADTVHFKTGFISFFAVFGRFQLVDVPANDAFIGDEDANA